jgi:hypothetical protein
MSDMISACRFTTGQFTKLRHKIGLLALAIACVAGVDARARESKDWIVLENCRLISNPANDGDSFHAAQVQGNTFFASTWLTLLKRTK